MYDEAKKATQHRVCVGLSSYEHTFKTQDQTRRVMGRDKTDSYQTRAAPKQITRREYMRYLRPKPVTGVARSIQMARSKSQGSDTKRG